MHYHFLGGLGNNNLGIILIVHGIKLFCPYLKHIYNYTHSEVQIFYPDRNKQTLPLKIILWHYNSRTAITIFHTFVFLLATTCREFLEF